MEEYFGWAIEARSSGTFAEPPFLLGRYSFTEEIPPHMKGHVRALFKTRALARRMCPKPWTSADNKHWYVAVKVKVAITKAYHAT